MRSANFSRPINPSTDGTSSRSPATSASWRVACAMRTRSGTGASSPTEPSSSRSSCSAASTPDSTPRPDPPFVLNLASRDEATLARSRAHCRAAIDLSRRLGGAVYAAHAGYTADLSPEMLGRPELQAELRKDELAPRHDAYATLVESVRDLCAYARERGLRFLI